MVLAEHRIMATIFCLTFNAAFADKVVLKNGDRVTGAIAKKDAKSITIKTDHFGVVTTDWDQVESVTADKPVNVVFQNGRELQGTVTTADGILEVDAPNAKVRVPPAEIALMRDAAEQHAYERLLNPSWTTLWTGNAALAFAGAIGNARTSTLTTSLDAARITNSDKTTVYFKTIHASALTNGISEDTASAVRAGWAYDHNLGPKWFLNAFNDWEHDRFQSLDLRFVIGGGVGYHLIKNERTLLDLLAGFDYNHSSFFAPSVTKNTGELFWGDEFNFKMSSRTSIVQSFRMFNNLSDTATYRINGDLSVATKLKNWLTWNVSLSDRYLSTPAPGRKTNDLLYTTGLGVTFAR
jgi:putative salt-induced outer membrane protein YdiY